jgi:hypothetical protein
MADLKTNYVDDVLDTTKNQLRKYQQIQNDDGTVSFVDVTEYTQVGTSFGARDINDTNAAINDVNGKLPEYIDIIAKCPASTWCNIPLPDAILSTNRVIDVNRPADSDSNVYGVIWWPSADKQITILRINTNGTNLTIDNTAKTIKLRIWFC